MPERVVLLVVAGSHVHLLAAGIRRVGRKKGSVAQEGGASSLTVCTRCGRTAELIDLGELRLCTLCLLLLGDPGRYPCRICPCVLNMVTTAESIRTALGRCFCKGHSHEGPTTQERSGE